MGIGGADAREISGALRVWKVISYLYVVFAHSFVSDVEFGDEFL